MFGIRLGHGNLLYTAVAQDAPSHPHTDPRALFWVALTTFINDAQATNSNIILIMDANADFQDAAFRQFLSDCTLTDLHSDNTSEPALETYFRGTERINYILGSANVCLSDSRAGI